MIPSQVHDPFAPLPREAGQRFLFRAVWDGEARNSSTNSITTNNGIITPSPSLPPRVTPMRARLPTDGLPDPYMGTIERRYFEKHLYPGSAGAGSRGGSSSSIDSSDERGATPLVSWYTSYGQAVRRCVWLQSQGCGSVQILVVWGAKLTLYDAEAIAEALGYNEEEENEEGKIGRDSDEERDEGEYSEEKDTERWQRTRPSSGNKKVKEHADEVLSWGDEYVDDDTLVTHIDWSGRTVRVEDPWHARIPVPESLIAPRHIDDVTWIQLRDILRHRLYWNFERTNFTRAVEHLLMVMANGTNDL